MPFTNVWKKGEGYREEWKGKIGKRRNIRDVFWITNVWLVHFHIVVIKSYALFWVKRGEIWIEEVTLWQKANLSIQKKYKYSD